MRDNARFLVSDTFIEEPKLESNTFMLANFWVTQFHPIQMYKFRATYKTTVFTSDVCMINENTGANDINIYKFKAVPTITFSNGKKNTFKIQQFIGC